jgi:hypothetical protein
MEKRIYAFPYVNQVTLRIDVWITQGPIILNVMGLNFEALDSALQLGS